MLLYLILRWVWLTSIRKQKKTMLPIYWSVCVQMQQNGNAITKCTIVFINKSVYDIRKESVLFAGIHQVISSRFIVDTKYESCDA